ncbi:MAG: helix-turn-helix domain-containing protein [Acidimicrobiia bacterium]
MRRGVSKADVARRFGVSDEAVRQWWKRYEDEHDHGCWSRSSAQRGLH